MTRGPHVSPARRARHLARVRLSESPRLYLPVARRRYPGPSPQVIGESTEMVIDGYTRCGSTFAVYAFQLAQPRPVRLAHHLHASAQVVAGVRRGLPTLTVIREPQAAVLSQLVREPHVDLRDALLAYARFYEQLLPHREGMVVGELRQVTGDLGAVVRRLNDRFGTAYAEPVLDADLRRECAELATARSSLSPVLLGFESGTVSHARLRAARTLVDGSVSYDGAPPAATPALWVPSAEREREKAELAAAWAEAPERLRYRAQLAYERFTGGEEVGWE
jgi:hypothetical protein